MPPAMNISSTIMWPWCRASQGWPVESFQVGTQCFLCKVYGPSAKNQKHFPDLLSIYYKVIKVNHSKMKHLLNTNLSLGNLNNPKRQCFIKIQWKLWTFLLLCNCWTSESSFTPDRQCKCIPVIFLLTRNHSKFPLVLNDFICKLFYSIYLLSSPLAFHFSFLLLLSLKIRNIFPPPRIQIGLTGLHQL